MTVRIEAMPNFRDAGGHATADGRRVRTGVLYRSDQIGKLSDEDARQLSGIGIRFVYDLRTAGERATLSTERIPGATHVVLDVLADDRRATPAQVIALLGNAGAAGDVLGDGKAAALMTESYRSFLQLESARAGFGQLYRELADAARVPALVHCTTGKDRTGWACASLQLWLGVPYEAVLQDFLASNRYILPKYESHLRAFAVAGGDPELLLPVLTVREEYLAASLHEMQRMYGSIDGYFSAGLGLGPVVQRTLRERFLDSSADHDAVKQGRRTLP